jgi:hypothetical protein
MMLELFLGLLDQTTEILEVNENLFESVWFAATFCCGLEVDRRTLIKDLLERFIY